MIRGMESIYCRRAQYQKEAMEEGISSIVSVPFTV